MSIVIDKEACVGCGSCIEVCPGSLIFQEDGKSYMKYPKECWGCTSCLKECEFDAISYYLGADIGGNGTTMKVREDKEKLHWRITKNNQEEETIVIDKKKANSY